MPLARSASAAENVTATLPDKADFYVSPRGNDSWSGRLSEPAAGRAMDRWPVSRRPNGGFAN